MEEMDVQQQFCLFQKELEAAAALTEQTKLDLVSAIDTLKIEVEVLSRLHITRMKMMNHETSRLIWMPAILKREIPRLPCGYATCSAIDLLHNASLSVEAHSLALSAIRRKMRAV